MQVIKKWLENQTNFGTLAQFIPNVPGDYVISVYVDVNTSSNIGSCHIVTQWTDKQRGEVEVSNSLAYNSSSFVSQQTFIHVVQGTTISVNVNDVGGAGSTPTGSVFDFYVIIDRL